jgi:thrombospondin type 3 repeat protein
MPSRFSAQSGKGVLFVALALVATLLLPSVYTWAVKPGGGKPDIEPSGLQDLRENDPDALKYYQRLAPEDRPRRLDVNPMGSFKPNIPDASHRNGLITTQQGLFNPKDARAFDSLPADLRPTPSHPAPNGKGMGLGASVGIVQISQEAITSRGIDAIQNDIRAMGVKILGTGPDRALVVRGNDKSFAELLKAPFVEASLPYAPAFKIEPATGTQQLLDKVRSGKSELDIHIQAWDSSDVPELLKDLKAAHGDTVSLQEDGQTIHATVTVQDLRKIARDERVRNIGEIPEYQLASFVFAELPPVVQVGENEHTGDATPYWDAGVDGGGCGNATVGNTDTRNCGTAVPPTIVAVLDNGASTDAATLAHSVATLTEASIAALISGGTHRKIASYQLIGEVSPLGTSCDSVLSGGQTHGNIIAGTIAGNASQLGFQITMVGNLQNSVARPINFDGVARGARLTIQDAGVASQCTAAEIVERGANISPGTLPTRMDAAYSTGARLHVMAFGIPNWAAQGTTSGGVYTADAAALDNYLVNNLEYQVFVPVGNRGFSLTNGRDLMPDFFDGESSASSDPATVGKGGSIAIQTSPPATAKNIISVGATCTDVQTMFGAFNEEDNPTGYTAKGPATATSLRAAPIIMGVGNDRAPTGGGPNPMGMYSLKSRDNNQGGPVEAEINEQARGTSFGAASVASGATIMEDYFHQGFYPTGDRIQADRVTAISGAAIKALVAASGNFGQQTIGADQNSVGMDGNDIQVAVTRGSIVTIGGQPRVLVNSQQGYGRSIVDQVLPIANWPNEGVPEDGAITGDTIEKPGIGLLVWDGVDPDGAGSAYTAEPPITNASGNIDHHFRVMGTSGQIRACLAWPDPSAGSSPESLVNDLDLQLISPSNKVYNGNVYNPFNQILGQWGIANATTSDTFNPIECVHLHDNPDGNPTTSDDQIEDGVWTLRIKRGVGGAVPNQISQVTGPAEDGNATCGYVKNNRLDAGKCSNDATRGCNVSGDCVSPGTCTIVAGPCPGGTSEDLNGNGLLDNAGQVYAAVVSGPLVVSKPIDAANPAYMANFPDSIIRMDKIRYSCSDDAAVNLWDAVVTAGDVTSGVTINVKNASGTIVDTETPTMGASGAHTFFSNPIPVRLISGGVGHNNNNILEGDTGYTIEVTQTDATAGSRPAIARAPMDCEPNFLAGQFLIPSQRDSQDLVFGGCDRDQFFDANELVTYSVAVVNFSRTDEYTDVVATLTACAVPFAGDGTCATPSTVLSILDSPKSVGRLPIGQPEAVSFSVKVSATPLAQGPKVFLRLVMSETSSGKELNRLAYTFTHAMSADRESVHYSTDYPNGSGGAITRDLNRSLTIDPNDRPQLTLGLLDETVSFSSMFTPLAAGSGPAIHNVICTGTNTPLAGCVTDEAYPALGIFNGSTDTNSNGIVDRHVLSDTNPATGTDLIPWNFDNNNGGWYTQRDAASILGNSTATLPLWHYVKNGTCGFQTQSKSNCVLGNGTPGFDNGLGGGCVAIPAGAFVGGVWHTGSGVAGTCTTGGAACYLDEDCAGGANGPCVGGADNPLCGNYGIAFNPATGRRAEFILDYWMSPVIEKVNQGLDANGFPFTVEFQRLAYNDTVQLRYAEPTLYIDADNNIDSDNPKAIIRSGNGPRGDGWQFYIQAVIGPIDPYYTQFYYNQRTFGPTTDPDSSLPGSLSGDESGFTGFDSASTNQYATKPIIPTAPINLRPFPGPNEVHVGQDTVAGPSRSTEIDMVGFENTGLQFFTPGDAGNRFQIGLGFLTTETTAGGTDGDFGFAIDDVVFEWDEVHPIPETTTSCAKIGTGAGELAAGCKCSTLSVDRTNLYDCNDTLTVVVNDSRYAAGAVSPCVKGTAGAGNDTIQIKAWSNSEPFPGETVTLTEDATTAGVFRGTVQTSGVYNSAGVVFTTPGTETNIFFAYEDDQCDSNQNHLAGQSSFSNLDGDGLAAAQGRDGICNTDDDIKGLYGPDNACGAVRHCSNDATKVCSSDSNCVSPGTCLAQATIDDTGDNCALVYNPLQGDDDGDKVGGTTSGGTYFGCDNCPFTYNPTQADGDQDGVGDACDFDDVDGDGVVNDVDNCPDTYNPTQVPGTGGRGTACDSASADADGDGVSDKNDTCVNVYNNGLGGSMTQADTDGPFGGFNVALGDACDGDCIGTCTGGVNNGKKCTFATGPFGAFGKPSGVGDDCPGGACTGRVCSTVNDDADLDAVKDSLDNCPDTYNQTILPGSNPPVQADDNFNGIGNECDPVGNFDENNDGIPDDVANGPFFALAATCKNVPLANLVVLQPIVRDRGELSGCTGGPTVQTCSAGSNVGKACTSGAQCPGGSCATVTNACGDGDSFGDPGERVRIGLFLQNITGINLTGINLSLSTGDPDIACILDASITIPSFPNGASLDTRSLTPVDDAANPSDGKFFEVVISDQVKTVNPASAARANLVLTMNANEAGGTSVPIPVTFLEALDIPPGASPTPTASRCDGDLSASAKAGVLCATDNDCAPPPSSTCPGGICPANNPACKPGLIYEDFESPGSSPTGTGGVSQNNDFSNTIGFIERNAAADSDTTMVGKSCFGFMEVLGRTAAQGCQIDPDYQTDWHFEQSGAIPFVKAFHGLRSAHWGRHTDPALRSGDTTPLREIEAFVTNPINLTIAPQTYDLVLSFYHIVSLNDDNRVNFQTGQAGDRADVQIAVDQDPSAVDNFGRWQKLAPFQNVYEHTTQVFSWFGLCEFTPTDAAKATNPTAYGETMCFPDQIWSHSGAVLGFNTFSFSNAQGPGFLGSQGEGTWVQSKFNLGLFVGQRVKIRWIGNGWDFGNGWNSNMEPPGGANPFDIGVNDDGWWVDSIQLTGAVTTTVSPVVETVTIPLINQCPVVNPGPGNCPTCCDETKGTNGWNVVFNITESNPDDTVVTGETLLLDASQSVNSGGCANGAAQFRFTKSPASLVQANNVCIGGSNAGKTCLNDAGCPSSTCRALLQDWSSAGNLKLGNSVTGDLYDVEVRCSADFSCTTGLTASSNPLFSSGVTVMATSDAYSPVALTTPSLGGANITMNPGSVEVSFVTTGLAIPGPPPTYGLGAIRTDAMPVGNGAVGVDAGLAGAVLNSPSPNDITIPAGACILGATPGAACVSSATCGGGTCQDQRFRNVLPNPTPGPAAVAPVYTNSPFPAAAGGSCYVKLAAAATPNPVKTTFIEEGAGSAPPLGTLYYYLGNMWTKPGACPAPYTNVNGKCWDTNPADGAYGTTRVGAATGFRYLANPGAGFFNPDCP